jgi:penicillin-binding protein 1B
MGEAMEKSLNAATARIAQDVGIRKVRDMAYRMGIQSRLPLLPSLALGAVEVTPLEMAGAFSALANNGVRTHLLSIKNVLDRKGTVLEKRNIRVKRVLSPQVAFDMNNMLRRVVDRGTARGARQLGFTRPAAGKTGTTNDARDAWFAGYTPDLLALVWVGFDRQSELGLSGSRAALPIWTDFMKRATSRHPVTDFVTPPGVSTIDARAFIPRCPDGLRRTGPGTGGARLAPSMETCG